MFRVFVHPVGRDHYIEDIVEQVHFQDTINLSCGGQGGWGVNFQKPGLKRPIYQNIVTVTLKAVLIINDDTLNRFEWDIDNVIYLFEALICKCLATGLLQIETEILNAPLRAMLFIIVLGILLNGYICQVNKHIIQFSNIRCVFLIAKTSES